MDATYFYEALAKQTQMQQHQLNCDPSSVQPASFDFASFPHLAQVAAGNVAPSSMMENHWKQHQHTAGMTGSTGYHLHNSSNPRQQVVAHQQQLSPLSAQYNMISSSQISQRSSYPTNVDQDPVFHSDSMAGATMDSRLLGMGGGLSTYTREQSAIINQHQKLDAQQEQVISASDFQSSNFNSQLVSAFLWIEAKLCAKLKGLTFCDRVSYIYNPLEYASDPHAHYVSKYCGTKTILFLGMNPGPFGMAQNGVPFGDTRFVKEWLKISGQVNSPEHEHPKRLIHGLDCTRSEVSGARFWGFIAKICRSPEKFFQNCFVHNYCPLIFITKTGKNVIPAALPANDRRALEEICDNALLEIIRVMRAQIIVAVGKYASERALHVLGSSGDEASAGIRVVRILHPSPASPQANSGWEEVVTRQLQENGVFQLLSGNSLPPLSPLFTQ